MRRRVVWRRWGRGWCGWCGERMGHPQTGSDDSSGKMATFWPEWLRQLTQIDNDNGKVVGT